jgi:aldose 1-epimerase
MKMEKQFCFTHSTGEDIYLFALHNVNGTEVNITNYGAIITSFKISNINIVLGFENPEDYMAADYLADYPYMGCEVGRYANRIKDACFEIDGVKYNVSKNRDNDHLHGGFEGFQQKVWKLFSGSEKSNQLLALEYKSMDGEEGYPGTITAKVEFELTDNDELIMITTATTDKPTAINLTHHDYFNLNGEGRIDEHLVRIPASKYLGQDNNLVADGRLLPVAENSFDFNQQRKINAYWDPTDGYDQTFLIDKKENDLALSAVCRGDKTGLQLEVFSTEPVVHFYTGKWLPVLERNGKKLFGPFSGFCLETQVHPNAINIPHFPNTVLRPGEKYEQKTMYLISQAPLK